MFPPIRAARALPYLKCLPSYRAVQHVAFTVFVVMAALAVTAPAAEALTFTVNNTGDIDDGGTLATGA